jgi:ADP-heptose:LPS heptosyltransferase
MPPPSRGVLSRRQRWKPVSGFASRVYEPWERWLLAAIDLPRIVRRGRFQAAVAAPPLDPASVRRALVLRLDRMGDLLMSLPAIASLRAALPHAHLTLAVGQWCAQLARRAPVDAVVVWSAPWVGRRAEGADSLLALSHRAWALRGQRLDLALDLQGDVRAALLMALAGARARIGYANTGGGWLLTHAVPLDERVSWVEQNRMAVARAVGAPAGARPFPLLTDEDRVFASALLSARCGEQRPLIGLHPSGGRFVKQWDLVRWARVASGLVQTFGAKIVLTGSAADRPLTAALASALGQGAVDLAGTLDVDEMLAIVGSVDLFLSSDTGPMHMACALGTPSVSVFGPSDPARYFSGGSGARGSRHVVVRADLWCSPCNLIRRPPRECQGAEPPECLRLISAEEVLDRASESLRASGYASALPHRR